jgi:hypothetical protein
MEHAPHPLTGTRRHLPPLTAGLLLVAVAAALASAGTRAATGAGRCTPSFHRLALRGVAAGGLNDILALAPNDVWAVGSSEPAPDGSGGHALIAHWDGRSWAVVPSPRPQNRSELSAIAAAGADDVWAVGESWTAQRPGSGKPLIVHWDGKSWRRLPVAPVPREAALDGVAALAPDDVWAVGSGFEGGGSRGLALHWNGSGWRRTPTPAAASATLLHAVVSWQGRPVAVGVRDELGSNTPLVERWTGTRWKVVFATDRPGTLWAAAAAGTTLWGVGGFPIYRWDDRWKLADTPLVLPGRDVPGRTEDVSVGFGATWVVVGAGGRTVLARWTGHGWARTRPVAGSILAVDARADGVWAAGITGAAQHGYLPHGTPLLGRFAC